MGQIRIIEVGPRDGLQNESYIVPTDKKIKFIGMLKDAGLKHIEATSFVNPKSVPQMFDSSLVLEEVLKRWGHEIHLPCLVPNLKGLNIARAAGAKEIALFSAASNTFSKKNANASIDESLQRLGDVAHEAISLGIQMRGYVSTVFGCPYEGKIIVDNLLRVVDELFKMGVYEVSLGDTIGIARPGMVYNVIKILKEHFDLNRFAMHFHDTRGMGMANILASLQEGITHFDSSAGGLGGCPYAPGSTGNVCTEELVWMIHSMGHQTGIDLDKVLDASIFMLDTIRKMSPSRLVRQLIKERKDSTKKTDY